MDNTMYAAYEYDYKMLSLKNNGYDTLKDIIKKF